MNTPLRRKGGWWVESDGKWHKWRRKEWIEEGVTIPPPPRWSIGHGTVSEPLAIYLSGISAALLALAITICGVDEASRAAVLAPVIGLIGTFTGHAAGHSGAVAAMRQKKE